MNHAPVAVSPYPVTYMICTTQRSGSTMLSGLLEQTGSMGRPRELLNVEDVLEPLGRDWGAIRNGTLDMRRYLREYQRRLATPNGVVAAKVHFYQLEPFLQSRAIRQFVEQTKLVFLLRRDLIAQAASLYIARETNEWVRIRDTSGRRVADRGPVVFDAARFDQCMKIILWQVQRWLEFFAVNRRDYHVLTYEDLFIDPAGACARVAEYCGVNLDRPPQVDQLRIERQADALNQSLSDQYRAQSSLSLDHAFKDVAMTVGKLHVS